MRTGGLRTSDRSAFPVPSPTLLVKSMLAARTSTWLAGTDILIAQEARYDLELGHVCDVCRRCFCCDRYRFRGGAFGTANRRFVARGERSSLVRELDCRQTRIPFGASGCLGALGRHGWPRA